MYSHGFASQRRQVLDLVAMHVDWAVVHVHLCWLLFVWPANAEKNTKIVRLRFETHRGRERDTGIENVLIKWINTSIYWIIIIGLIHFCCFHSLFSRLEPLACVQIVTFQISVFFLSNCNARILCWFTLKCQQNSIKETLIFGLFPRNFIGASSFKFFWAKAEAGKKQLDNHIFRSYWNAQCEPITQIHSNFGKCWTYTNKRIRKISSSFCSLNHMKRNRQNECFFPVAFVYFVAMV